MSFDRFHPAVADWFRTAFGDPTPVQAEAWPAVASGRHALIAAPTGSGKTLAAFLAALDDLVRQAEAGPLENAVQVVYVSPLRALSNDIRLNLEAPLAGIEERLNAAGSAPTGIRTMVRTGDTPQAERDAMRKRPPHILVTTPESLHILLTSESGRGMLETTRTVIVDEIHAMAPSKRGAHLALSLERLEALADRPLTRVGLSATQKPIVEVARFLVGAGHLDAEGNPDCRVIDAGHYRRADLAVEVPQSPLEAVMANEVWEEVYDRIADLAAGHRTTLVFANTRRTAERVARHLGERLGEEQVAAHHGSLSRDRRLAAERALKHGEIRLLVATASLELGIDIGEVDLVVQLGSTRTIANFLQRVGRSGHAVTATPKGRLFPLSRDDLVECIALVRAARDGALDRLWIREAPLEVLAQQITAEVAAEGELAEAELLARFRRAYPYRALSDKAFADTVQMLADGFATGRGRKGALIHRDSVNRVLRPRRGARLTAVTCAGTIPDQGDFDVVLEPEGQVIGSVNEDFALEAMSGDIFQLGNRSYRFLRIQAGRVRVEDANGLPPSLPFWFGEAPGRTEELTAYVSDTRRGVEERLGLAPDGQPGVEDGGGDALEPAVTWLAGTEGVTRPAAEQAVAYLAAARFALGALPALDTVVLERFFDESGGMQLVVHSPFGSRVNKAWGLALRKRFCRKFNFELQAAATEDTVILSLATAHSFPLEEAARYLSPETVREVLVQALLDAPLFTTRWRWNATTALAIRRFRNGGRTPPQLQRMEAEDLISAVFPDQIACFENLAGDREVPDHPLVNQTIHDCLHEAMDIEGLERVLAAMGDGGIRVVAADLTEPSPLSHEILNARPYAFLDDAPAEERRTRMVQTRRYLDPATAADIGHLDADAIARVREEAWPDVRDRDELHDALDLLGAVTAEEGGTHGWGEAFQALREEGRAFRVTVGDGPALWVAAERWVTVRAVHPEAVAEPVPPESPEAAPEAGEALRELVRGRLDGLGPTTAEALAADLRVTVPAVEGALAALETEGAAFRGRFTPDAGGEEWCERRLLARIHRYTLDRLRREIEPVEPADYTRFLLEWHALAGEPAAEHREGPEALLAVIEQLEGFEAPAAAWESEILPARLPGYDPQWLDQLCLSGRVVWIRLTPPGVARGRARRAGSVRTAPVALVQRKNLPDWKDLAASVPVSEDGLSGKAAKLEECLRERGAQFFDELASCSGMLRTEVEEALGELVAWGRASSDSFAGLRALLKPAESRSRRPARRGRGRRRLLAAPERGVEEAGRWAPVAPAATPDPEGGADHDPAAVEAAAWTLLERYGVVLRAVLAREPDWLPPWRELLRVLRRLEDRGEVRGGRFVAGFWGEQFALPEAVGALRKVRKRGKEDHAVTVAATDPLNLVGILTPGERVTARTGERLRYRDGVPEDRSASRSPAP
ncbi:DEAD/DEAH box helicase [Thiohalorhabdus sp. Cl-TMA]|uniref:DEAD/DEAH box helicase n=1 Tax=Thiohalorhabdus methylotrophus TaxID=3242694 RepID=A0ABV4TXL3_9GAMM